MEDKLVPYEEHEKSRMYLLVFTLFAVLVGAYFWLKVRPQLIYAGCLEVATKSSESSARFALSNDKDSHDRMLDQCLTDFNLPNDINSK